MAPRPRPPRRVAARLATALALAGALAGCRAGEAAPPAVRAGDAAPAPWAEAEGVTVGWVFRVEDGLACVTPSEALRHLAARHGDRLRLSAVYVGESGGLVESLLRRERLRPEVVAMERAAYNEAFGASPLPALYVIERGRIVAAWPGVGASVRPAGGGATTLENVVNRLMAEPRETDNARTLSSGDAT